MTGGIVFDIKRFSIHDGPGIRTTIFLKGCGLRCQWCHNPESQRIETELLLRPNLCIQCGACIVECPQGAIAWDADRYVTDHSRCLQCGTCVSACYADAREIVGREMTVDDVMAEIIRDEPFYDESGGGVTFSGGEPLLQADFLFDLLRACKDRGLHTAVDTCGYAPNHALEKVAGLVDLFLYDLKLMDSARHRHVTGASNTLVLENLCFLSRRGSRIIVRIPIIPEVNDDEKNIRQTAQFIQTLPAVERVDLLAYHRTGGDKYGRLARDNPMPDTAAPSEAHMAKIKLLIEEFGLRVSIGG